MTVKDTLRKNVPARLQNSPEFSVFLKWITQRKLRTSKQVEREVDAMIEKYQGWLDSDKKTSTLGTKSTHLRQHAKRLRFYKTCRDKFCAHL